MLKINFRTWPTHKKAHDVRKSSDIVLSAPPLFQRGSLIQPMVLNKHQSQCISTQWRWRSILVQFCVYSRFRLFEYRLMRKSWEQCFLSPIAYIPFFGLKIEDFSQHKQHNCFMLHVVLYHCLLARQAIIYNKLQSCAVNVVTLLIASDVQSVVFTLLRWLKFFCWDSRRILKISYTMLPCLCSLLMLIANVDCHNHDFCAAKIWTLQVQACGTMKPGTHTHAHRPGQLWWWLNQIELCRPKWNNQKQMNIQNTMLYLQNRSND